ncbi:MAG: addiction module protein [Nitrospirota bacterium]
MATNAQQILQEVLTLSLKDRAALVNDILASLDQPDEQIDLLWRKEIDDRVAAYRAGNIRAVSLEEVLSKYRR